jgi:hypothetical protein
MWVSGLIIECLIFVGEWAETGRRNARSGRRRGSGAIHLVVFLDEAPTKCRQSVTRFDDANLGVLGETGSERVPIR